MAACPPQALLDNAACFDCLPGGVLAQVQTALLCQILKALSPMATCSVQTLIDSSNCFSCLQPGQLALIQTQLLCEISAAIGGGGGGSAGNDVIYETTDPTTEGLTPTDITKPSVAYKRDGSGAMFGWNPNNSTWS